MGEQRTGPVQADAQASARERASAKSDAGLESVIAAALVQLARETGARRATAWPAPGSGGPVAATSGGRTEPAGELPGPVFAALAQGECACDLALTKLSEPARELVRRFGFAAVAPVGGTGRDAAALLLLQDVAEGVRPRTLAALDAAAKRLSPPIAAARAAARLAELDADVRRLDRLAGIGALLAEIVHEVRNPLVSVKTFLQLLPENFDDPEFRENFLPVATNEVGRIERLLDAVLEQARPSPSDTTAGERGSVASALETVTGLLAHRAAAAGITLAVETPPDLPAVALATDSLRQVVLNLATNALEATAAGGDVRLAARSLGHAVETSVADRGPGVPAALRRRVFEPFFSTKPGRPGGLGLAISRRIVEEVGGTLVVLDRPDGGAIFRLRLPSAPEVASEP